MGVENSAGAGEALAIDQVGQIERHGIDLIAASERNSRPKSLFFVFLGSQMCFGIIVIGAVPIALGLGFWSAVTAITVGLFLGSVAFGPVCMLGARTGTNGPVASGAHFGVSGRLIGTFLTIFIALGFYALTVWTGGEALAAGSAKLFGWTVTPQLSAIGAAIICAITILAAIYGHATIVATETFVSYAIAAVLVIIAIVLAPQFDASYAGGEYALGGFWQTWFLSAAICAAVPISYVPLANDYSRYLPEDSAVSKVSWAAGSGMFIGCWIAFVFATYVATIVRSGDMTFVTGLISVSPLWIVVVTMLVGLIGSQPQGSLCLYGCGLSLEATHPSLRRVPATIVSSLIGLAIVFLGIFALNMESMILAFLAIIECAASPWLAILLVGHFAIARGNYTPYDLFAFSSDGPKGIYWYSGGWNVRAVIAWAVGFALGVLFVSTSIYTGPLASLLGGISLEWIIAGVVGGLLYYLMERRQATRGAYQPQVVR